MSRFLPPDHSKGDETTVGGYEAVHARPAAFDGPDGFAYSVAMLTDALEGDARGAFGAYFLFLRWTRVGEEGVEGHVESECLEFGPDRAAVLAKLGAWPLARAQEQLNALVTLQREVVTWRDDADEDP
jgi:hypothetical protein